MGVFNAADGPVVLPCALAIAACTMVASTSPSAMEVGTMDTSGAEASPDNPTRRAEGIGARVLVLFKKLESLDDLRVDRIEQVMGST